MTLQELKQMYCAVFYLEDTMILDVILAVTIASKLGGDPIWLLIIGGSSSGKSELINTLNKVPFNTPISSMTENTFLSAMRSQDGKEMSLLHRIGTSGMITMKDYTSILSMRSEKRDLIVSQMREIYDGKLVKEAGNGNPQKWEGKINWIGACTDSIYIAEGESAGMGRRTINYIMPQQDRKATTRRSSKNNSDIGQKRDDLQNAFAAFITDIVENMDPTLPELEEELGEELINLADFCTRTRTPTERNYKGELVLVPDAEMPMRVNQMFQTLAKVFMVFNKGELSDDYKKILYRLALDSIPKQRIIALKILATYEGVTSKGAAQVSRYPTETMRMWLEDLNVLGVCERDGSGGADVWKMNQEFRDVMIRYGGVVAQDIVLLDPNEGNMNANFIDPTWIKGTDDKGKLKEIQKKAQEAFEKF